MSSARILLVEDERIVATDLARRLTRLGYTVVGLAASGLEAIVQAGACAPDLVLMDVGLPGEMNGLAAAAQICAQRPLPVIYLTAYTEVESLEAIRTPKPLLYVRKPVEDHALEAALRQALAFRPDQTL